MPIPLCVGKTLKKGERGELKFLGGEDGKGFYGCGNLSLCGKEIRPRPRGDVVSHVRNMDQLHFQNGPHVFISNLGPPLFVFLCL